MPTNTEEMFYLAGIFMASGMVPKCLATVEKVFLAINLGMEVGLTVTASIQNIMVVNNRASVWGDAAQALVIQSGKLESMKEFSIYQKDGQRVYLTAADRVEAGMTYIGFRCEMRRVNFPDMVSAEFTVEDAKAAGLLSKDNWKYPKKMCKHRARNDCRQSLFADVLMGMTAAEDVEDGMYPDESNTFEGEIQQKTESKIDSLRDRIQGAKKENAPETDEDGDIDLLNRYYGHPPYDNVMNTKYSNQEIRADLQRKHDMDIAEIASELGVPASFEIIDITK